MRLARRRGSRWSAGPSSTRGSLRRTSSCHSASRRYPSCTWPGLRTYAPCRRPGRPIARAQPPAWPKLRPLPSLRVSFASGSPLFVHETWPQLVNATRPAPLERSWTECAKPLASAQQERGFGDADDGHVLWLCNRANLQRNASNLSIGIEEALARRLSA